jgi:hypothetical protein
MPQPTIVSIISTGKTAIRPEMGARAATTHGQMGIHKVTTPTMEMPRAITQTPVTLRDTIRTPTMGLHKAMTLRRVEDNI